MAMEKGKGKPRCKHCGFRVRGLNHDTGTHHSKGRKGSEATYQRIIKGK